MPDPLEVVAARIARLALRIVPGLGRVGPGPVLTVVRNTQTGQLYVGFNTGVPQKLSDTLYRATLEHHGRMWEGGVHVVRTDAEARGAGHSEVNALNPAILEREKALGRKLVEKDLSTFELHNIWLRGDRVMTAAPRCEHCARITRGVLVTQSVFRAEGGVVGEIEVPRRGSATPAGGGKGKPATATGGETKAPPRGSMTRAGSSKSRATNTASGTIGGAKGGAAGGVLTAMFVLSVPLINEWFAKNYLNDKWTAEAQAMVMKAIGGNVLWFNIAIMVRKSEIEREQAAGREVRLRVDVDTEWVDTNFGPAQISASVSAFTVLLEGEIAAELPLFQKSYSFWESLLGAARITRRRSTYYFTL